MSEKEYKHESDLMCIAHILKHGNCKDINCHLGDGEHFINFFSCPLEGKYKCENYVEDINDWMEEHNVTKSDLIEYMFD